MHNCENCIFSDTCTLVEKQAENSNLHCGNYMDIDGEADYWCFYQSSVSWRRYVDNLFDYRCDVDDCFEEDDEDFFGFHIEMFDELAVEYLV